MYDTERDKLKKNIFRILDNVSFLSEKGLALRGSINQIGKANRREIGNCITSLTGRLIRIA